MTTAAWDGKRLSADTRSITSDTIDQGPTEKIFSKKGVYCAVAGDYGTAKKAANWLLGKGKKPKVNDDEFEVILVSEDRAEYYDESLEASPLPTPYAIGSGRDAAMGAMLAGASSKKAVKIAAKLDANTSVEYGISTYRI